jgi:hypothetical protein
MPLLTAADRLVKGGEAEMLAAEAQHSEEFGSFGNFLHKQPQAARCRREVQPIAVFRLVMAIMTATMMTPITTPISRIATGSISARTRFWRVRAV